MQFTSKEENMKIEGIIYLGFSLFLIFYNFEKIICRVLLILIKNSFFNIRKKKG